MCDEFQESVKEGRTSDVIAALACVGKDGSRIDPTADDNYAVRLAASNGHVQVVRVLLEWVGVHGKRVDPTAENTCDVRWAAWHGNGEGGRVVLGRAGSLVYSRMTVHDQLRGERGGRGGGG